MAAFHNPRRVGRKRLNIHDPQAKGLAARG